MTDLSVNFGDFSATQVEVTASSEAGHAFMSAHFGPGAVSCILPKSGYEAFARAAQREGLRLF